MGGQSIAPLPVIVHLLAGEPNEMHKMIVKLETIENVVGVEIGFSADVESEQAEEVIEAAVGEIYACSAPVSFPRAVELAEGLIKAGASAVHVRPTGRAQSLMKLGQSSQGGCMARGCSRRCLIQPPN